MSQWADRQAWAQRRSAEACVICRRGTPNDMLAELEISWVTVNEDAPMRGPIDPKAVSPPVYAPRDFAAFRARLLGALTQASVDGRERARAAPGTSRPLCRAP